MIKLEKAIDRAYHKANLNDSDNNIDEAMQSFKAIRDLSKFDYERIYNDLALRLGYRNNKQHKEVLKQIEQDQLRG